MKVSTNVGKTDPKKKKVIGTKTTTSPGKTTEVTIKAAKPAETSPGSKTYKPTDERTGAPSYGKESKTKPTPDFVKDAQAKKQDIVEKDGKKYRAGETTVKLGRTTPATPALKVKVPGMPVTKSEPIYEKTLSKKKPSKLKARAMTYGTVNNKTGAGGTKYKMKVRAK